jgi:hypothetical protein
MSNTIKCPHCGKVVEITEALRHEIKVELDAELEKRIRKEFEEELAEKNKKLEEMRSEELKIRAEKRRLEEAKKDLELQVQRKIDEEKRKMEDNYHLKEIEKDKKIADLMKSLEEAKRKVEQGSQQTQGEVLELDLEESLKTSFPQDLIEPVGKGVRGADIKQTVRSKNATICGVIMWETKRTKDWKDEWLVKLKNDLRNQKANIPVIVTTAFPKSSQAAMILKEGVWIVSYSLAIPLAILLRKNLLDVGFQKAISEHKGRKADLLYEYVTGHEFVQQVESFLEVFREMQDQLAKERISYEKLWKAREGQIKRLASAVANIYGGMQGLVGSSMPQIKGLELSGLESGE